MKNIKRLALVALVLVSILVGCKPEVIDPPTPDVSEKYDDGIFVSCEGAFSGVGSVAFLDENLELTSGIFELENGVPVGNILQSISIIDEKAYLVVNNSNKIEVVDAGTFVTEGTIANLVLPRYMQDLGNGKAYVSQWNNSIAVVDLATNTVTSTISTNARQPEKMLLKDDKVYVTTCTGTVPGSDSIVYIIDVATNTLSDSILVGEKPDGIVEDNAGNIWIICGGSGWNGYPAATDTKGKLVMYNPAVNTTDISLEFPSTSIHPEKLAINKDDNTIYYLYDNAVYSLDITNPSSIVIPTTSLYDYGSAIYGMDVDQTTGNIFIADAIDYSSAGTVVVIDNQGTVVKTISSVGVIPSFFQF